MATTAAKKALVPTDMLYLLTFGLGMLAFWVSGHVSQLLPPMPSEILSIIAGITVTGMLYGLGMFILAFIITRQRILPTLVATLVSIILGVITAQVIVQLATGHINDKQDLGILTFVLFLCYGTIYVVSLAIGRKIAKTRAA